MFTFNITLEIGAKLNRLIRDLFDCAKPPKGKITRLVVDRVTSSDGTYMEGEIMTARVGFGVTKKLRLAGKDADGNKANFEAGTVEWTNSNPEIAELTFDPSNEKEASYTSNNIGTEGTVVFEATADGDRDPNSTAKVVGVFTLSVYGNNVTVLDIEQVEETEEVEPTA